MKINRYALPKPAVKSLITDERAQKFELLSHLIANLRRPLVVCGPHGIGKTTLLSILCEQRPVDGFYLPLLSDSRMDFASIRDKLAQFIQAEQPAYKGFDLADALDLLARDNRKLVLILDNAGLLQPGIIDALSDYSLNKPALRVIFSLTQDDAYIKANSDRSIDDCHFIELPTLTQKQCREFLQNLSGRPDMPLSFNAVSDLMVEHLYRETHGIPGQIIEKLPKLSGYDRATRTTAGWSFGLMSVVAVAVMVYLGWSELFPQSSDALDLSPADSALQSIPIPLPNEPRESIQEKPQVTVTETDTLPSPTMPVAMPAAQMPVMGADRAASMPGNGEADKAEPMPRPQSDKTEPVGESSRSKSKTQNAAPVLAVNVQNSANEQPALAAETSNDDKSWLRGQSPTHFTLQLMVLSSQQSIVNVMNKYRTLRSELRYIETTIGGKQKFILLFGSYATHAEATRAANKLPGEFKGAWVRRFAVLQSTVRP
ncbi:MAG: hypothetical protein Kow0065_21540 [Methylomicrobium sp.]